MSRIPSNLSVMANAASIPGVQFPSGRPIDPNTIANIALFHLDCVVVENQKKDKKFTIFMDQIDKHIIENPNIFDEESFRDLQNRNIGTEVSFVNEDDPFYKLDEALPMGVQNRVNELLATNQKANLSIIINDIALYNKLHPMLKIFKFQVSNGGGPTTPKLI
jgi:hypothetical protein